MAKMIKREVYYFDEPVENIWSLLKRSLVGSYHKVSKKNILTHT